MSASRARYVAIIPAGTGRGAPRRGLPVLAGHEAGADVVKARLRDAVELGVEELTVYSFSTENWTRPKAEVDGLMAMFAERIDRETPELHEEGVRMRFVGRREGLDAELQRRMDWAEETTGGNERITLFVAFNYGGRAEIVDAARSFDGDTEEDFRRITAPTLVLIGDRDETITVEDAVALYRLIPGAELGVLPAASHLLDGREN